MIFTVLMIFPTNGPLLQTNSVQHREYKYGLLGRKLEASTSCLLPRARRQSVLALD